jgi:hypothetical protein
MVRTDPLLVYDVSWLTDIEWWWQPTVRAPPNKWPDACLTRR